MNENSSAHVFACGLEYYFVSAVKKNWDPEVNLTLLLLVNEALQYMRL